MSRVRGRTAGKRRWKKMVCKRPFRESRMKFISVCRERLWVGGREGRVVDEGLGCGRIMTVVYIY